MVKIISVHQSQNVQTCVLTGTSQQTEEFILKEEMIALHNVDVHVFSNKMQTGL